MAMIDDAPLFTKGQDKANIRRSEKRAKKDTRTPLERRSMKNQPDVLRRTLMQRKRKREEPQVNICKKEKGEGGQAR